MRSVAGVDAGMSFTDATTGVCRTAPWVLTTAWADRASRLAALALQTGTPGPTLEVVAIDAPLLPGLAWSTMSRAVEVAFQRGAFQKRGKPGLSHIPGTGQGLRRAGHDTAHHLRSHVAVGASSVFPRVAPENLVEAFPNAYLAVLLFERDGFEVQVASDGDMLVRLLDEDHRRGADPDVLLLDHRMPFYTGLEVLDGLRVWGFHKPAVMITAFGELVRDAHALGATVLEKPFDPDTLRRMVFDRVGWADRLLDISEETEREVVEVRCASCGRCQRLVADEVRVNPPTYFCLECRERAAPLSDDELGEGD